MWGKQLPMMRAGSRPAALLVIQFPADMPGKAAGDGQVLGPL